MNKQAEPFLLEADLAYADYLRNTRARIEYHFRSRGTLAIDNGTDEFVCVLTLPLER